MPEMHKPTVDYQALRDRRAARNRCPLSFSGFHNDKNIGRCLLCDTPLPMSRRRRPVESKAAQRSRIVHRDDRPAVGDISGWGEDGNPW